MGMTDIRQPQQERSIETKRKIVEAGFNLFGSKGFYKTNTAQIAKDAGVSTGIVYGYFNNKKDILIEVIKIYNERVYTPILNLIDELNKNKDLDSIILKVLNLSEKLHAKYYNIHQELNAIAQMDEDINKAFIEMQDIVTSRFVKKLQELSYKTANNENVHIAMNLVQTYVHEAVYDKHEYLNYNVFKQEIIKLIKTLFTD